MARTVRGGALETRAARLRLKPRGKPYWVASARAGLHLGYRRLDGKNGSWIVRRYQGKAGEYETRAFAQADDYSEGDGAELLTYYQAMERIAGEAPAVRHGSAYRVSDACEDYVTWLRRHRKSAADTQSKLDSYVIPRLGERLVSSLTETDLEQWLEWALTHKPRGRLKTGKKRAKPKRTAAEIPGAERLRRKHSTLNRVINALKGALNHAFDRKRVTSADAWARLQKFRGADSARLHRLTTDEAKRLLNACAPDFRRLVEAALVTGCRYGELVALTVRDFDEDSGTILVAQSKSGKARRVPLTDEGTSLFAALAAGKVETDRLLVKADGTPWAKSEQFRRMNAACAGASINPPVNFHALRHTFASLLVEAGTPLAFVAEALGHADTRMVSKHYAHLAPNVVHDTIRANLPSFGVQVDNTVRKLRP